MLACCDGRVLLFIDFPANPGPKNPGSSLRPSMSPPDYTAIYLQINSGTPIRHIAKDLQIKTKELRELLRKRKLTIPLQSEVKKRVVAGFVLTAVD